MMVTLREIATRCGCSVATVSKALNDLPDIGAKTTAKIKAIADEMGYYPNVAAKTLKTNSSKVIGLLTFMRNESVWVHEHYANIITAMQSVTDEAGFNITPISYHDTDETTNLLRYCKSRRYDGIIVLDDDVGGDRVKTLLAGDIPIVTIDAVYPQCTTILSNDYQGMTDLVTYAYQMGHRKMAFIHGQRCRATDERVSAFQAFCKAHSLRIPKSYLRGVSFRDGVATAKALKSLLALKNPPTCIFFPDDFAYMGCIRMLHEMGLSVPKDISVAAYDALPVASLLYPKLTTVSQNSYQMGSLAAQMLIKAIDAQEDLPARHVVVENEVMYGETIADINP